MNNISVLIDFSETSRIAIKYSCRIARKANAKLQLFHISDPGKEENLDDLREKMASFSDVANLCTGDYEIIVEHGNFLNDIPDILNRHNSELAMIATHGVKGIFHTIQGADVLQLVRKFSRPSLVVQQHTPEQYINFERILLPISAYTNYDQQVSQTAQLAKLCDGTVQVFVLLPEKGELEQKLKANLEHAKAKLDEEAVNYEVITETSKVYEIGYAKQAVEYASNHDIHLISILAFPAEDTYFGNVERSDFILNKPGIPVLCCSG